MRRRVVYIAVGAVVLGAAVLVAYPLWLRSQAERAARAEGCRRDGPPGAGFLAAMRDDERVAAFPGFGASDRVAAEASFCVGTFAQACLAAERLSDAERRPICERWKPFATWYASTSGNAGVCPACPGLLP